MDFYLSPFMMNDFATQPGNIVDLFDQGESTVIRGTHKPSSDLEKSLAVSFFNYFVNDALPNAKLPEGTELPYAFYKDTGKDSLVSGASENETVSGSFNLDVNSVHDLLVQRATEGVVRKSIPLPSSFDDNTSLNSDFMSIREPSVLTVSVPGTNFLYHIGPAKNIFEEGPGFGYNRAVFGRDFYNLLVKATPKFAIKPAKFLKKKFSSCVDRIDNLKKRPIFMTVTRYETKPVDSSYNNL